jgi:prolyl oligopeptidase
MSSPHYPSTRKTETRDLLHGVSVADPYRWLEDARASEVQEWMRAQDGLTRAELQHYPGREAIAARLKELLYTDSKSAPMRRGNRWFYSRRHADREKAIVYFTEGRDGAERVLFDPNTWSTDGSFSLGGWQVSWDGTRVAYQVHKNNSDEATLYVMDVGSGRKSTVDVIEGAKYAAASWTPRGDGFYYTWLPVDPKIPVADRPGYAEVRFHQLGHDPATDRVVRGRTGNASQFLNADLSRDGHWLVLTVSYGWTRNDVYFRDTRIEGSEFRPLAVGRDASFGVWPWKDRFYVHTNDGASRWKLYVVDPAHAERERWREVVPERTDATLESFVIIGGRLALNYLRDAASQVEIRELDGRMVRELALPTVGTVGGPLGLEDDDEAFFVFTSFTFPKDIYSLSVHSGQTRLWYRSKVPVDPAPYVVEQVFCHSRDGTRVPMFLVHRRDLKKDGSTPTILNGYGGFQVSLSPAFESWIYPWLERGGMYAVANLRGGGEYGEAWHRAGMKQHKQNVFDDFIAAAEYLIKEHYTRPQRLAIEGGSNGGLLVGAVMVQRPELFGVVLCGVPLLDMVRYHLFGSGKTWAEEYGTAESKEDFKTLFSYSPYHHVRHGAHYPAVLLASADSDDRVDPMHARKFAAALQEATSGGPVLLRIERQAGHGGADLIRSTVELLADEYAFLLAQMRL